MYKTIFYCVALLALSNLYPATPPAETAGVAELVITAFYQAYPDKISQIGYDRNIGDWYLIADGEKFFWANGRLLPEQIQTESAQWRPYVDYQYPWELADPADFSEETIQKITEASDSDKRGNAPPYNIEFYDALYDGKTRNAMESHIITVTFLGKTVSVHEDITGKLRLVEQDITAAAQTNQEVQTFIDNLLSVEGYNWREIADSQSRSNHSWGIAVDILPVGWGQKNLYWNWISYWNDEWMLIPLDRRWTPPKAVVDIFESHGFIWGGKWALWDNMHFEYRPELLLLREWTQPRNSNT